MTRSGARSAGAVDVRTGERERDALETGGRRGRAVAARLWRAGAEPGRRRFLVVVVAAAASCAPFHLRRPRAPDWLLFVVLRRRGRRQLLPVETHAHSAYSTTLVFFVAGALLLPPQLVALMSSSPTSRVGRGRYPWYVQTFNIANWVCASLAAYFVCGAVRRPARPRRGITPAGARRRARRPACVLVDHACSRTCSGSPAARRSARAAFHLRQPLDRARASPHSASGSPPSGSSLPRSSRSSSRRWSSSTGRCGCRAGARRAARPEDGALQRALLHQRARRRARTAKRFERPLSIVLADLDLLRESEQHLRPPRR